MSFKKSLRKLNYVWKVFLYIESNFLNQNTHVEGWIFSKWQTGNIQAISIQIWSIDNVFLHFPCRHSFSKNIIECSNWCVIDIFTFWNALTFKTQLFKCIKTSRLQQFSNYPVRFFQIPLYHSHLSSIPREHCGQGRTKDTWSHNDNFWIVLRW